MESGELTAVYCIGENPVSSEADSQHATKLLESLDTLIVQDIFMTKTAEIADVVFPAANSAFESEGTVTNSERRVQRVRKALEPPGEREGRHLDHRPARDAARVRLGRPHAARGVGRTPLALSDAPGHDVGAAGLDGRRAMAVLGRGPSRHAVPARAPVGGRSPAERLRAAPFSVVIDDPPVDELTDEYPIRLTTGRRLDSFNTGVQTGGYSSPLRRPEEIELSQEDAERARS